MRRNWLIVFPAALALWGVLTEKVSLLLLAIVAYFAIVWYLRRGPIGKLASVPADAPAPVGNLPSNGRESARIAAPSAAGVPSGSC